MHRMAGYFLLFALGVVVWPARQPAGSANRRHGSALQRAFRVLVLQVVDRHVPRGSNSARPVRGAPVIAIVHQFGAVVLWVLILRARFLAAYPLAQSVRG